MHTLLKPWKWDSNIAKIGVHILFALIKEGKKKKKIKERK